MTTNNIGLTNNIVNSLNTLRAQAGYFLDEQYSLVKVEGKDAGTFLQSQLTNDINELKPGLGQFTCLLDRKAHVEAYFHLYRDFDPDTQLFYILAEKEQIPNLIQTLELYRFAANVKFTNISQDGRFFVIQGPRVNRIFNSLKSAIVLNTIANTDACDIEYGDYHIRVFRHSITGENGYFFWVAKNDFAAFKNFIENICINLGFIKLDHDLINIARVESGLVKFGVDFDRSTLLPETGLTDTTVNYKKGCFVGQEILARVRSHGVPAKAIIGLTIDNEDSKVSNLSFPLNSAISISGEEIGTITSAVFSANKLLAFSLKRDYRVPQKEFLAQITDKTVNVTVTILPFRQPQSNKELAHRLYEDAVQKYIQESENSVPVEAICLLQEVLILTPHLEDAYEALAVILSKHGQLEQAIALMKNLSHLNADSVMAHSNLSQFYVQQGLKELAEEEKAIALGIRMRLAAAQFSNKEVDDAAKEKNERLKRMEMFKQVLAIDAEDFFANAGTGECLVAEKEFEKAIPYLKKAIEMKPIHLTAYLDLASYKGANNNNNNIVLAKEALNAGIAIATKRGDMAVLQQLQSELEQLLVIKIEPYQSTDLPIIVDFVKAIQEHERLEVSELKPGSEMGDDYVHSLLENVANGNGIILMAKLNETAIGFVCAYISEDDDLALRDEFHSHALISDIYVAEKWRRQGIASKLLTAIESEMKQRQCQHIRIWSKATNPMSLKCYETAGYKPYEIIFSKPIT